MSSWKATGSVRALAHAFFSNGARFFATPRQIAPVGFYVRLWGSWLARHRLQPKVGECLL